MNVPQLLHPLAFRPMVEIIKPRLPESFWCHRRARGRRGAPGLADFARPGIEVISGTKQTTHEAQLERLYRGQKRLPLRFAHQQVDVLRHDDVAHYNKAVAPHPLKSVE